MTFQSFPVISGLSDNHAREIVDMLSSVVAKMPKRGIILFDMGISNKSKLFLQSHCNVTVRSVRRDIFADMVANFQDYRWKALLIYSTFLEFDGAIWADASIRFKNSLNQLQLVRNGVGFIGMEVHSYSPAGAFTHDGMLEAFGVRRESVATSPIVIGGSSIWFKQGGDVASTVLKHWLACSMTTACISLEGATLGNCNKTERLSGRYIGCHRFDQSALSVITEKIFPNGQSNERCIIPAHYLVDIRRRITEYHSICLRTDLRSS